MRSTAHTFTKKICPPSSRSVKSAFSPTDHKTARITFPPLNQNSCEPILLEPAINAVGIVQNIYLSSSLLSLTWQDTQKRCDLEIQISDGRELISAWSCFALSISLQFTIYLQRSGTSPRRPSNVQYILLRSHYATDR